MATYLRSSLIFLQYGLEAAENRRVEEFVGSSQSAPRILQVGGGATRKTVKYKKDRKIEELTTRIKKLSGQEESNTT